MDDVPHITWPIRLDGTSYAVNQQDTADEVAAAVAVICSFERGSRVEDPDYGIIDPTFQQQPVDASDIEQQVGVYEPRAELEVVLIDDPAGEQQVRLNVRVATVPET